MSKTRIAWPYLFLRIEKVLSALYRFTWYCPILITKEMMLSVWYKTKAVHSVGKRTNRRPTACFLHINKSNIIKYYIYIYVVTSHGRRRLVNFFFWKFTYKKLNDDGIPAALLREHLKIEVKLTKLNFEMKICVLRTFFTCIFDSDFQEVRELFIFWLWKIFRMSMSLPLLKTILFLLFSLTKIFPSGLP